MEPAKTGPFRLEFAAAVFHSISMQSFAGYTLYHPGIREAFAPYEEGLFSDMPQMEQQYRQLRDEGKTGEAQQLLNAFVSRNSAKALEAADSALENMKNAGAASGAWKTR